jgi:hypothetical protein
MRLRVTRDSFVFILSLAAVLAFIIFGSSGCSSGLQFTSQPVSQGVYALQTTKFKVAASGGSQITYQWQKNGTDLFGATSATYTTPRTTAADTGAQFRVVLTSGSAKSISNPATLTVNTGIYENMRLGQNSNEKVLTTALVNASMFGKIGSFKADGLVDAQPLYLTNVMIPNVGPRNVLYVATEHGTVFRL